MNIFGYLKTRLTIQDVVAEYVTLTPAGSYLRARCPFHHERTASFTVSSDRGIFYCFGCQAGGDLVAFVAQAEHCTQFEAASLLIERYNITVPPELAQEYEQRSDIKKRSLDVGDAVAHWCHEELLKNARVMHYLEKRGFNAATLASFQVGYFPAGSAAIKRLERALGKNNILPNDLVEANIILEGKSGSYSPFEERIIFPIKDMLGRTCAFGGRVYQPDDARPKYYNSPESSHFNKGSMLFGLDSSKKAIQKAENAFLVEGYTDCMAMVQHGFANTVATLGTACTAKHLQLIARYTPQLTLLYDGDAAGTQAMLRLAPLCWQAGIELRVATLPVGQDPASFLASGGVLSSIIADSRDIFSFFITAMGAGIGEKRLRERASIIRKILEVIATVKDRILSDILLQQAAEAATVPLETIRKEFAFLVGRQKEPIHQEVVARQPRAIVPDRGGLLLEKKVFCAIINDASLLNQHTEKYVLSSMPEPYHRLLLRVIALRCLQPEASFAAIFDSFDGESQQYVSGLMIAHDERISVPEFNSLVLQLSRQRWRKEVLQLKERLAQAQQEGDAVLTGELLKQFALLKSSLLQKEGPCENGVLVENPQEQDAP